MFSKQFKMKTISDHYNKKIIFRDISAGFIVAFLFIPQSMAYANIAGMNPVYGLYAATIPLLFYTLFSSSKHLSVGPTSIISILAFSGISSIAPPHSLHFYMAMTLLSLMVGLVHLCFGFFHIGKLFNKISSIVIKGFISAVAIIIVIHQLDTLFGIHVSSQKNIFELLFVLERSISSFHPLTTFIGIGSILVLYIFQKVTSLSLGPLFIIFLSTILVHFYHLNHSGVEIVGFIPNELPNFLVPDVKINDILSLIPTACMIAIISCLESLAIAKSIAEKAKYSIHTGQELIALAMANLSSAFIGSIPVGGAISRTAVNFQSGAKTKLANFVTLFTILGTLIYFTNFIYYLPISALSAVIIVSVSNLIDVKGLYLTFKKNTLDGYIRFFTFLSTLIIGVYQGFLIGLLLSVIIRIYKKSSYHN